MFYLQQQQHQSIMTFLLLLLTFLYPSEIFCYANLAPPAAAAASFTSSPAAAASSTLTTTQTINNNNNNSHHPQIIAVHTNCTRDLLELHLSLNSNFRGLLYAKDFPLECRARGNANPNITLRVPTSGCGVRAEPLPDGSGVEYSMRIMLQIEQKLRLSSDILRTVRCILPAQAMGMQVPRTVTTTTTRTATTTVVPNQLQRGASENQKNGATASNTVKKLNSNQRNGRMRNLNFADKHNVATAAAASATLHIETSGNAADETTTTTSTTATATTSSSSSSSSISNHMDTPRVRIWLELGGPNGSGSVEVGVATTLTVRAIVPNNIGVRVVDCAALDGLGESTQQLLDERGCPIDEQVMPALHTRFKPAEEGWSKQLDEDLVEKIFSATFPAFKFPDRERLHVSCGVQLCKGKCPNLNCRSSALNLSNDKHLARIEVFNSLAVVDRSVRYDRRYNISEEHAPKMRPLPREGTLCLSISKLAISFCVLGLIFLIAVIVAITSLIRTRKHRARHCTIGIGGDGGATSTNSSSRLHRAEICTSMFSSSSESAQSTRFGSRLFIPHYPNKLPYGRVY